VSSEYRTRLTGVEYYETTTVWWWCVRAGGHARSDCLAGTILENLVCSPQSEVVVRTRLAPPAPDPNASSAVAAVAHSGGLKRPATVSGRGMWRFREFLDQSCNSGATSSIPQYDRAWEKTSRLDWRLHCC